MDDFLYNVRTGNMRNMDKSRRYDNNRYKSQNRQQGKDRRKGYVNYRSLSTDQFSAIKEVLGSMVENQQRQTKAMENIARQLEKLVSISSQPAPAPQQPVAAAKAPSIEKTSFPEITDQPAPTPRTREEMVTLIHQLRKQNLSYEKIADVFEAKQISTLSGRGKWRGQTIYRLFKEG